MIDRSHEKHQSTNEVDRFSDASLAHRGMRADLLRLGSAF